MKPLKIIGIFFVVWLFLVSLSYALGYFVFDQGRALRLAEKGVEVSGKVIAKEPLNHNLVRYSYVVEGREFTGSGSAGRGNGKFDEIQIGQTVIVYYEPNNPSSSFLGSPQVLADSQDGLIFLMMVVIPIFPLIAIVGAYLAARRLSRPT